MADVRVPKSMPIDHVIWAFRHGVLIGMMHRGIYGPVRRHGHAFVSAPRNVLQLADRVRREWERRHPRPTREEKHRA